MGHDLTDGENEIESALCNESVHLCWPRIVQLAFRLFVDIFRRHFAEGLDVGAPIVNAEKFLRHGSKHSCDLFVLHGGMRAKSRQNRLQPIAVILPRVARQVAGAGMNPALIWRYDDYAAPLSKFGKTLQQQSAQVIQS